MMNHNSFEYIPEEPLRDFPGTPDEEKQFRKWIKESVEPLWLEDVEDWIMDNTNVNLDGEDGDAIVQQVLDEVTRDFQKKISPTAAIKLPGYGYSLDRMPKDRFPVIATVAGLEWTTEPLFIRELCILKAVEEITNKPAWWVNVRDTHITELWKKEILGLDWNEYIYYADFTPSMADWCIEELKFKADLYEKTDLIPVLDCAACVIKSDKLVSDALKRELSVGSQKLLQDVPNDDTSNGGLARHLIDPSMCPLIYNRSRILPDRRINLTNCLEACSEGDVLLSLGNPENDPECNFFDASTQWLPCDVIVDEAGSAKIDSYINNLHPVEHAAMYTTIEKFIALALPAWDIVYRWPREFCHQRINAEAISYDCKVPEICADRECSWTNMPAAEVEKYYERVRIKSIHEDKDEIEKKQAIVAESKPTSFTPMNCDEHHLLNLKLERNENMSEKSLREFFGESRCRAMIWGYPDPVYEWFHATHPLQLPEPNLSPPIGHVHVNSSDVRSSGFFSKKNNRLQVIVKLAEIHLTPEHPEYNGGIWDMDGALNEHIVSTALFCYDSDNITDCYTYFDTAVKDDGFNCVPDRYSEDTSRAFAMAPGAANFQTIGRVLTDPGRAIFYPNIYRHCQGSFSLVDRSRAGYHKVLKLCLVDPAIPIISTSNVPPQQYHWWTKCKVHNDGVKIVEKLPPELQGIVHSFVDFPIDNVDAKRFRDWLNLGRTVGISRLRFVSSWEKLED